MAQTLSDLLDTLNVLVSDPRNQKWTEAIKIRFINSALRDVVSSETKSYVRIEQISIRDVEYEYEFPADMLEAVAMMIQSIEGAVVVSSSWRSLLGNVQSNSLSPYDSNIFWQVTNNFSGNVTLRDIVSDNKFIFSPYYNADDYSANVLREAVIPATASVNDIWVDSFEDEMLVYKADTGYTAAADLTTVDIDASLRPSTVGLTFTYDTVGIKYVTVDIVRGGASGVSSVAVTGDADDRANPLTYTYTIFDDQSSNDTIIALTPAGLTVTGASATDGAFTEVTVDLLNPAADNWTAQTIHLRYIALYPPLANGTDELRPEIPPLIREGDCIPLIAAYKLLKGIKGDSFSINMYNSYKKEYQDVLERSHKHRMNSGPPNDIEPG